MKAVSDGNYGPILEFIFFHNHIETEQRYNFVARIKNIKFNIKNEIFFPSFVCKIIGPCVKLLLLPLDSELVLNGDFCAKTVFLKLQGSKGSAIKCQ